MSSKKNNNYDYNDRYIYSSSNKKNIQPSNKLNSKKIRNKKIFLSLSLVFFIIIGLIGGAFIYIYKTLDNLNYQPLEKDDNTEAEYISGAAQDPMILNVALFGVDRHAEEDVKSRSDSIMILSLDSRRKKIKLTSLMRDIWLSIPGHNNNRINTAIAYGGEQLAIKTIEQNFGIKIDRFCSVDFEGFRDIIDIIGGLDIDITKKEAQHINKLLRELDVALKEGGLQPFNSPELEETDGVHHMNGAQALQYARSRKVPTAEGIHDDFARTFRQRRVISLVVDKLKTSSLPKLLGVIEKAGPYINTNLKKNEIITLGKNCLKYLQYEVCEFRLPEDNNVEGKNINGASVLVIKDMNTAKLNLAKFIYEDSIIENSVKESYSETSAKNTSTVTNQAKSSAKNTNVENSQAKNSVKNTDAETNQAKNSAKNTKEKSTKAKNTKAKR